MKDLNLGIEHGRPVWRDRAHTLSLLLSLAAIYFAFEIGLTDVAYGIGTSLVIFGLPMGIAVILDANARKRRKGGPV